MSTLSSNTISTFVSGQIPEYLRNNFPAIVEFITLYYQWLESPTTAANGSGIVYGIRNMLTNVQLDTAPNEFLRHMANSFLPYWPQQTALSLNKILKHATQFYQTKGTAQALEFLFEVLYGLPIQIYYPGQRNVMRLSSGKWQLPQSVKLQFNDNGFPITELVGRLATGAKSYTTATIETANLSIDPTLNQEILELFLSGINGEFQAGEDLIVNAGVEGTFKETIIGSISSISINPNAQGLQYVGTQYYSNGSISYQGDPVSIIGALSESNTSIEAIAFVGNVTQGSITGVSVDSGGQGFQLDPNTIVIINNGANSGANIIVNGIDTSNQSNLVLNTDSIEFKSKVAMNSANFTFSNFAFTNVNTSFQDALSWSNVIVAPISSLEVVSQGSGFATVPTLTLESIFRTDYAANLYAVYEADPTTNNWNAYINAVGLVSDAGYIANVSIVSGGSGYTNSDSIEVDSVWGYDAEFDFTLDSGTINSISVVNTGRGYQLPIQLRVISDTGSGAKLMAYGYGQGEQLTLTTSQIGQIEDFRIENYGFNYIGTPVISLRNEDITIDPISSDLEYYQTDLVYQGSNVNSATFTAFVDQYQRSNNILRLYNYVGSINVAAPLVGNNVTATVVSANVYGNGKALANAEFFGGLIKYPGFWLDSTGQLSTDQYLQGNTIYQTFSYLVKVERSLADWGKTIKKINHPSGMLMSAITTVTSTSEPSDSFQGISVEMANSSNNPGTVTVNAFSNGLLTGTNTSFTGNVSANNLIVLNTGSMIITKLITDVINNEALMLESNTYYFSTDRANISTGSNLIYTVSGTTTINVGDVIQTNANGNSQTSLVLAVDMPHGNIEVNTVFSVNSVNTFFAVYPNTTNIVYTILRN